MKNLRINYIRSDPDSFSGVGSGSGFSRWPDPDPSDSKPGCATPAETRGKINKRILIHQTFEKIQNLFWKIKHTRQICQIKWEKKREKEKDKEEIKVQREKEIEGDV